MNFLSRLIRRGDRSARRLRVAVCTCVKNERPYLREWLAHYRRLGFDDIYVYENESSDGSAAMLQGIDDPGVVVVSWRTPNGLSPQLTAFERCAKVEGADADFIAFFDADEFLVEMRPGELRRVLNGLSETVQGLLINQRVVGSNGNIIYRAGPVMGRFRRVTKEGYLENVWVKSIVRPKAIKSFGNPHIPVTETDEFCSGSGRAIFGEQLDRSGKVSAADHKSLALNHYILKSYEEFLWKRHRGGGASATPDLRAQRYANEEFFSNRNVAIAKCEEDAEYPDLIQGEAWKREQVEDLRRYPVPWTVGPNVLSTSQRRWLLDQLVRAEAMIHFGVSEGIADAMYLGLPSIAVVSSLPTAVEGLQRDPAISAAIKVERVHLIQADLGRVDDYGHPMEPIDPSKAKDYVETAWSKFKSSTRRATVVVNSGRYRVACACFASLQDRDCTMLLRDFEDRQQYMPVLEFMSLEATIDKAAVLKPKKDVTDAVLLSIFDAHLRQSI